MAITSHQMLGLIIWSCQNTWSRTDAQLSGLGIQEGGKSLHRLQLSQIFRDSHGIDCFVTGHGRPYHMPIVCHGSA